MLDAYKIDLKGLSRSSHDFELMPSRADIYHVF